MAIRQTYARGHRAVTRSRGDAQSEQSLIYTAAHELPPTTLQTAMRDHILNLWKRWDDGEAKQIAAVNFFLDAPSAERQAEIRALKNEVGECTDAGPVIPENWMRGQFNMTCATGTVGVFFRPAPTQPPAVQHLAFQRLASPGVRMGAPTGAPAGVSCTR